MRIGGSGKSKPLTTEDTKGQRQTSENYANVGALAQTYANLGCLGMVPSETHANLG
jgi:hypothetical protein